MLRKKGESGEPADLPANVVAWEKAQRKGAAKRSRESDSTDNEADEDDDDEDSDDPEEESEEETTEIDEYAVQAIHYVSPNSLQHLKKSKLPAVALANNSVFQVKSCLAVTGVCVHIDLHISL